MAIDPRLARDKTHAQTLASYSKQAIASLYTTLPGTITAYSAATNTANIELGVMQAFYSSDGLDYEELPTLYDVPILLDRAGNTVVTLPVQAGDECWVMFAHKSMNVFRTSGKAGIPDHLENGGLEDAVAIIKQISIPKNNVKDISNTAYQIRGSDNTNSFVAYEASSDTTTIKANETTTVVVAPDVITLTAGNSKIILNKDGSVIIDAPKGVQMNTPQLTVTGTINAGAGSGLEGVEAGAGTSTFTGGLVGTNGDIVADGISLKDHVHPGVQSGSSSTGKPTG